MILLSLVDFRIEGYCWFDCNIHHIQRVDGVAYFSNVLRKNYYSDDAALNSYTYVRLLNESYKFSGDFI